jgi:hypothetical protein
VVRNGRVVSEKNRSTNIKQPPTSSIPPIPVSIDFQHAPNMEQIPIPAARFIDEETMIQLMVLTLDTYFTKIDMILTGGRWTDSSTLSVEEHSRTEN